MVISEIKTKEVVERWQFDIQTEDINEEGLVTILDPNQFIASSPD